MQSSPIPVLLVDDDTDQAEMVRRTRQRQEPPFAVTVVSDGFACLEALAHGSYAVVLLDSQDWMASEEIRALWNAIDRTGRDNVRVIFRTAGKEAPLENNELAPLRQIWRRDEARSAEGFARDRSGIYGGFHCYERR